MALSGFGISFGDFHDVGPEEYEKLFGCLANPLPSSYLELPWNEDDYIKNTAANPDEGKPDVGGIDEELQKSPQIQSQQQQQNMQMQQTSQQQEVLPVHQQQQQQQDQQYQLHAQQQQQVEQQQSISNEQVQQQQDQQYQLHVQQQQQQVEQHQQQQVEQQQQQQQQQVEQQQQQRQQQGEQQQQQYQSHVPQQQQQQQQQVEQVHQQQQVQHQNQLLQQQFIQQQQLLQFQQEQQQKHQPTPPVYSTLGLLPGSQMVVSLHAAQAHMMAQAQAQLALQQMYATQQLHGQQQQQATSLQSAHQPTIDDDAARSSDGQNTDGSDGSKKRRNKKKRDPSYYATYYDDQKQSNRTETAYYADNESSGSGSSSAASSEAAGTSGRSGIEIADLKITMDSTTQDSCKDPNQEKLNQPSSSSNTQSSQMSSKSSQMSSNHVPERTSPITTVKSNTHNALVAQPSNSDQMAHKQTTATESSAIQSGSRPSDVKQINTDESRTKDNMAETNNNKDSELKSRLSSKVEVPQTQLTESNTLKDTQPAEAQFQQVTQPKEPTGVQNSQQTTDVHKLDTNVTMTEPALISHPEEESKITPVSSPTVTPAPKLTSWASLFKSSSSNTSAPPIQVSTTPQPESLRIEPKAVRSTQNDDKTPVSVDKDPRAKELGGALIRVNLNHRAMYILPRGLKNIGNWCYVNSILQALLACPPFYHLMKYLPFFPMQRGPSSTPMLDAMVELISMFSEQSGRPGPKKLTPDIRPGPAFEPRMVYQMMTVINTSLCFKQGRQEDAEELLGCLLSGLHEEMLALMRYYAPGKYEDASSPGGAKTNGVLVTNHTTANDAVLEENEEMDDEEWEQVGPRNKSSITRAAVINRSPLYDIFGGQMRSALHQQGSKESATLQPFFTLQLDIQSEKIWSVQEAIENLGSREALHGFTCNKTKQEVEASRRITLEELPPVLTLHLKRFVYDKSGGCQKVMKKLDYGVELEISRDLLSPSIRSKLLINQRTYKLFAVVYHTGKEASGGHYITDVFHAGSNGWIRLDDSIVKPIRLSQLIKPTLGLTPYLLFYRRKDLI